MLLNQTTIWNWIQNHIVSYIWVGWGGSLWKILYDQNKNSRTALVSNYLCFQVQHPEEPYTVEIIICDLLWQMPISRAWDIYHPTPSVILTSIKKAIEMYSLFSSCLLVITPKNMSYVFCELCPVAFAITHHGALWPLDDNICFQHTTWWPKWLAQTCWCIHISNTLWFTEIEVQL